MSPVAPPPAPSMIPGNPSVPEEPEPEWEIPVYFAPPLPPAEQARREELRRSRGAFLGSLSEEEFLIHLAIMALLRGQGDHIFPDGRRPWEVLHGT
jgi:hypothetical protein